MFLKKFIFILIILLFYQTQSYSKSISLNNFNSNDLSNYFSGIVASENKDNNLALDFFDSSKILSNTHDPYLEKYIFSLVLENKVFQAINQIKKNIGQDNSNFFDAHLLLILDSLKKNDLNKAYAHLKKIQRTSLNRFETAILESFHQYLYVFSENKILKNKKNFGKISLISETFQRCYLQDKNTQTFFSQLINDIDTDYSRYIFFYLSYLVDIDRIDEAKEFIKDIRYINSTLLLSQAKSWIENDNIKKIKTVFSCKNPNDIISEFLFLISNLYSAQDDFDKSNFYLNLSNFLNPKFIFNLSLIVENKYLNGEYEKVKKILKKFKKEDKFYFWYRVKKEAQIIEKQVNIKESLNFLEEESDKIGEVNNKILFDIANFYKNAKEYDQAIQYYTILIESIDDEDILSDLFYRRGGSFERIGDYKKADQDLLASLKVDPDDAYVLNYLAYSWLERNHNIDQAIIMLESAYASRSNDPYIIDSIGWAYYLTNDFVKAEEFLKRAVELMPDDPIVNDHYGDILWKLNRKIQARYFWKNVLNMDEAEKELLEKINIKLLNGLKNS